MGIALADTADATDEEASLSNALSFSCVALDFLLGLASFLHSEHLKTLFTKVLAALRTAEWTPIFSSEPRETSDWLHQILSSRQMPMLAIETLASMRNIVPLNYPLKFAEVTSGKRSFPSKRTDQWNNQSPTVNSAQSCPCADGVERLPESEWLAQESD
jgi:hypothetical protein